MTQLDRNSRILIVDDSPTIHEDFRKVLGTTGAGGANLDWIEAEILGKPVEERVPDHFELDSAYQGQEGLERVQSAVDEDRPYALVFVDIRMPPGWDGVETIEQLWRVDPELEIVICSAYSDHSWEDITDRLGMTDRLLVLKKPFDKVEVMQIAHALTQKWALRRTARLQSERLEVLVENRTQEMEAAKLRLEEELVERHHMEAELRLALKLEAVGQLAAGIAHEINTPVQYISDSVHFLRTTLGDAQALSNKYREGCTHLAGHSGYEMFLEDLKEAEEDADAEYLRENIPRAFDRAIGGLERVATIVQAMKDFAHDDRGRMTPVDLNQAIETTLEVARSEYKHFATVEAELGELPPIMCLAGEINQVLLSLVVNAAHAVADVVGDTGEQGTIRICSELIDGCAVITIEDTGGGMSEAVQQRVFDPFFTTKAVGRGTGQGLTIARKVVVDKHGGTLRFSSEVGKGSQFVVSLPLKGMDA